jgi:hypothetical protein
MCDDTFRLVIISSAGTQIAIEAWEIAAGTSIRSGCPGSGTIELGLFSDHTTFSVKRGLERRPGICNSTDK